MSVKSIAALGGCGIGMGAALSCKWVGLFIFAPIGLSCCVSLWRMLGDRSIPLVNF